MAKTKKIIYTVVVSIFLLAMVMFTLYPIIYTVLGSFKTNAELTLGAGLFPEKFHFENYYQAFVQADFAKYTLNSVVISLSVTFIAMVTSSLAGFIFARRDFPGKKIILLLYV
ncbi:MAG: carbohydrate ABC transporter permease, partial [Eubacterium sp.]